MRKCCHIVSTLSAAASLLDLAAALCVVASVEADAPEEGAAAEAAAAEIEVIMAVIAVAVVPSAAGDEDACGSADELRSLPRN